MNTPSNAIRRRARMPRRYTHRLAVLAPALALAGCAQVKPEADFAQARRLIAQATGVETAHDPTAPLLTEEQLDATFADGLSLEEALSVALLNNRRLHAEFASIGVAKAEWVQAGLLSNPTLGFSAQFPEGGGLANIQASIAQNIVDLWQIPKRKEIAQATLNETVLGIAFFATQLSADTKATYYRATAAAELLAVGQENLELVKKSYQAVKAQREAGTASLLDENLARGQVLSAQLGVRNARLAAANAKRSLARFMSVTREVDGIALVDPLPSAITQSLGAEDLIAAARENRLDLRALESRVRARLAAVGLEELKILSDLTLGLAFERGERRGTPGRKVGADFARASIANGALTVPNIASRGQRRAARSQEIDTILGPSLSVTLPIFDQNQAQIAKAQYLYEQELKAYQAVFIQIAQDIRIAADQARTASENAAFYNDELVPQAQRNLEFATVSYSAGQTSILILLEAQRLLLGAKRDYVDSQLAASAAFTELEQVVGAPRGNWPTAESPGSVPTEPAATSPGSGDQE